MRSHTVLSGSWPTRRRDVVERLVPSTLARSHGGDSDRAGPGTESPSPDGGDTEGAAGSPSKDPPAEENGEELPLDQIFEVLKNRRRREVLHYLYDNDGSTTIGDLSEHIAAIENDVSVREVSSTQRKRVYVGLYQSHLPKMDGMGVIAFDQDRGTVELGPRAAELEPYLDASEDEPWPWLYLAIAAAGLVLLALSAVGAAEVGLTAAAIAVFLVLATGAGAAIQLTAD